MTYSMKFDEFNQFIPESLEDYSIILADHTDFDTLFDLLKSLGFTCTKHSNKIRVYSSQSNSKGGPILRVLIEFKGDGAVMKFIDDVIKRDPESFSFDENNYETICFNCKLWCRTKDDIDDDMEREEKRKINNILYKNISRYNIAYIANLISKFGDNAITTKAVPGKTGELVFNISMNGRPLKNVKLGLRVAGISLCGEDMYQVYLIADDLFDIYYDTITDLLCVLSYGDLSKNAELSILR